MQRLLHTILPFAALFCCLALSGCAPKTTVVLVSDPQGSVGAITVSTDAGSMTIDQERESTRVRGRQQQPAAPKVLSEDAVQNRFREALAIQPDQPVHFVLQFRSDSAELIATSRALLPTILAAIRERDSHDISSIGHTDTAGDPAYNLRLSEQRAEMVARLLVEGGVARESIEVTSHGENNPVVRTGDNASESRNRRVEVVVR